MLKQNNKELNLKNRINQYTLGYEGLSMHELLQNISYGLRNANVDRYEMTHIEYNVRLEKDPMDPEHMLTIYSAVMIFNKV